MPNGLYIPQSTAGITQQGITGLANIKETQRRGELQERQFTAQQEQVEQQNRFKAGQQRLSTISALLPYADDNKFLSLINEVNQLSESMGIGSFNLDANKTLTDRQGFEEGIATSAKLSKTNPDAGSELFDETISKYQLDEQPMVPEIEATTVTAREGLYMSPSQRTAAERERRRQVGATAGLSGERLLAFEESGKVPAAAAGRGAARITDTKVERGKKQDYESFDGGQTWRKWGEPYSTGKAGGAGGAASLKWDKDAGSVLGKFFGTMTVDGYLQVPEARMAEYQDSLSYLTDYKQKGASPNNAAVLAARRAKAGGIDPIQTTVDRLKGEGKTNSEIKKLIRQSQFKSIRLEDYLGTRTK